MARISKHERKSVFLSWLFSYMLLLLVPILIYAFVYAKADNIIETEVNRVNMVSLKQCQQVIDNGLLDVNKLIYQVGLNNRIRQLMQVTGDNSHNRTVYDITNDFSCYKAVTGFVSDFFIYLNNYDKVMTQSGLLENSLYFDGIWKKSSYYDGMSYEVWNDIVHGDYSGKYIALQSDKANRASGSNAIVYTQSYPINDLTSRDATIVIVMDTKRFLSSIQNIQSLYNGWGMVLDEDNEVLFSTGSETRPEFLRYDRLSMDTDMFYENIGSQRMVVSYITSEVSHWKYVSVIPSEIFRSQVELIRNLTILGLVLCLLLGTGAAYYLTRRNYNPIGELIKLLENKTRRTTNKTRNEFSFIREVMDETISEKENIYKKLKLQDAALRSHLFQRLLKGRLTDRAFISNALEAYNIHFKTDSFAVMLFYISDFSGIFDENSRETEDEKLQFVQFIISNVVEELAGRKNQGYSTEIDGMLAFIINFGTGVAAEGRKELLGIALEAQEFLKTKFCIDLKASASGIHETLFGIPEAYKEALTVMEHNNAVNGGEVICYSDLNVSPSDYHYPMETEYQLINVIKSGDYENASALVNRVFEDNITKTALSTDMLRCFMFDMVSTVLKTVPEIGNMNGNSLLQELDIVNRLVRCEKLLEMKQEMLEILKAICTFVRQNTKDKKEEFIDKVVRYVQSHYSDVNLSVTVIAEAFAITPHYLTRIFKEKTGSGLFEYITSFRLEKAKELLRHQEYTIKDIAEMVGYYNSNVFIRAFKKHTGVTPGMFKDIR